MTLVILLVLMICLFAIAYFTKRRFGVLGLGLAAGLILSRELTKVVSDFLQYGDFPVAPLAYRTAASILLILAPAVLMLMSGPKYKDNKAAIIGSIAFGIFGTILLLTPLTTDLPLTEEALQPAFVLIAQNSSWIIAAGVIAAVIDMMYTHTKKPFSGKSKH